MRVRACRARTQGAAAVLARVDETASQVTGDSTNITSVTAALLAKINIKSTDIHVDSLQGRVILRGAAPDPERIAAAAAVVRRVEGLKSVDNRLVVN